MERCEKHEPQKTIFPTKNDKKGRDKVRFTNIARQLPLPFYFVADFECILQKTEEQEEEEQQQVLFNKNCCCGSETLPVNCNNCKKWKYCSELCKEKDYEKHKGSCIEASKETNKSSTKHLNQHVACGAAYKISCTDPAFYRDPVIITHHDGENVAERFLDSILHDARELREMLRYKKPMDPLTPRQQAAYDSPHAVCHICKKVTRYSSFFSLLCNEILGINIERKFDKFFKKSSKVTLFPFRVFEMKTRNVAIIVISPASTEVQLIKRVTSITR